MIDWHCHILPDIDDGSRSVNESLRLLKMQAEQGVKTAVATPHFYANDESAEEFLKRREASFLNLKSRLPAGAPEILLGAEVRYYPGISRMSGLKQLAIEGTRLLLLEMPMSKWTEYTVSELFELAASRNVTLILAHIERYYFLQSPDIWENLRNCNILMQANSGFFIGWRTRHKALNLLENGKIQLIGSDCHNINSRPPQIKKAFDIIQSRYGKSLINQMSEYGYSLLANID